MERESSEEKGFRSAGKEQAGRGLSAAESPEPRSPQPDGKAQRVPRMRCGITVPSLADLRPQNLYVEVRLLHPN